MITIRNTKLFRELQEKPEWETLFRYPVDGITPEMKDYEIPNLAGGLDYIEVKSGGIYFHDIGCNNRNNSFVIRMER